MLAHIETCRLCQQDAHALSFGRRVRTWTVSKCSAVCLPASGVLATYSSRLAATCDCQCCSDMPLVAAALQHCWNPGKEPDPRAAGPLPHAVLGSGARCTALLRDVTVQNCVREAVTRSVPRSQHKQTGGLPQMVTHL